MARPRPDTAAAYIGRYALKTIDDAARSGMRVGGNLMYDYLAGVHPGMNKTLYGELIGAYRQSRKAANQLGPRSAGMVSGTAPIGISQPRRYRYGVIYSAKIGKGDIPERWMSVDSSVPLTSSQLRARVEQALEGWRMRAVGRDERYRNLMALQLVSLEARTVTQTGR